MEKQSKKIISVLVVSMLVFTITLLTLEGNMIRTENVEASSQEELLKYTFTMDDSVNYALDHNLDIKTAMKGLEMAKESNNSAIDQLEDKEVNEIAMGLAMGGTVTPDIVADAKIQKELTLLEAANGYFLAQKSMDMTKLQVENSVETAYLELLKAKEAVRLAEENLNRVIKSHEVTKANYEQGVIPKSTLLDSEVMVEQANVALIGKQTEEKMASQKLNHVLNLPLTTEITTTKVNVEDQQLNHTLPELVDLALINRPDYISQEKTVEKEKEKYDIYLKTYASLKNANVKIQHLAYEKSLIELDKSKNQINLEVSQAYEAYLSSQTQLAMLEKSVEKAKFSLDSAELRYSTGMGTLLDVTSAQVALREAENNLLDATYGVLQAFLNLQSAVGMKLE